MKTRILLTVLICCMTTVAFGQTGGNLGMAGAYTSLAWGSEAILWNPANLAFHEKDRPHFTMTLFSLGYAITNNAFNLDDYEEYFTDENKVLSESEKNDIIGKVPGDGLELNMHSEVEALAMAYKNFAFGISFSGFADLNAPQDFFENVFEGLEQKNYNYSTSGDAEAVMNLNFAYGRTIWYDRELRIPYFDYTMVFTEMALGATFSYKMGMFAFESEQADVTTEITDQGIRSFGRFQGNGARLVRKLQEDGDYETEFSDDDTFVGSGFGLNLAWSARTTKDYTVAFVLKNVFNSVKWDKSVLHLDRTLDTGDPKFITGEGQLGDLDEDDVTSNDDREIGSFSTSRPIGFRLAAGKETYRYSYGADVGYEDEKPVFAIGGSYKWSILNFYTGYGYKYGHNLNFGFGLGNEHFIVDMGIGTHNGVTPGSTKGTLFATSLRFGF